MLANRLMLGGEGPEVVIDSYASSNYSNDWNEYNGATYTEIGQALAIASRYRVTGIEFYLKKAGSPTGNATFVIYATTGSPGTTGKPTGSTLATATLDVATLTTSYAMTRVNFDYLMPAAANLCIGVTYAGGDVSNRLDVGRDSSTPTHAGNDWLTGTPGSGWSYDTANDIIFTLYGRLQ